MKVIYKKIRFKNFLSFGKNFTEIDLISHKKTVVNGINGSGKCFCINTKVKLRNKVTGEIIETTVGEFYGKQEKQDKT